MTELERRSEENFRQWIASEYAIDSEVEMQIGGILQTATVEQHVLDSKNPYIVVRSDSGDAREVDAIFLYISYHRGTHQPLANPPSGTAWHEMTTEDAL